MALERVRLLLHAGEELPQKPPGALCVYASKLRQVAERPKYREHAQQLRERAAELIALGKELQPNPQHMAAEVAAAESEAQQRIRAAAAKAQQRIGVVAAAPSAVASAGHGVARAPLQRGQQSGTIDRALALAAALPQDAKLPGLLSPATSSGFWSINVSVQLCCLGVWVVGSLCGFPTCSSACSALLSPAAGQIPGQHPSARHAEP